MGGEIGLKYSPVEGKKRKNFWNKKAIPSNNAHSHIIFYSEVLGFLVSKSNINNRFYPERLSFRLLDFL